MLLPQSTLIVLRVKISSLWSCQRQGLRAVIRFVFKRLTPIESKKKKQQEEFSIELEGAIPANQQSKRLHEVFSKKRDEEVINFIESQLGSLSDQDYAQILGYLCQNKVGDVHPRSSSLKLLSPGEELQDLNATQILLFNRLFSTRINRDFSTMQALKQVLVIDRGLIKCIQALSVLSQNDSRLEGFCLDAV